MNEAAMEITPPLWDSVLQIQNSHNEKSNKDPTGKKKKSRTTKKNGKRKEERVVAVAVDK